MVILYIVKTIFFPIQPIIRIDLIDVSESDKKHQFSNQTKYEILVKEHCEESIDSLETNDKFIFGKFTTTAESEEQDINTLIDSPTKLCDNVTTVPKNFPKKDGTYLNKAIEEAQSQIKSQRNKKINYPVAITIFIESDDGGGETISDNVKQEITNLRENQRASIAVIGLEGLPDDNTLKKWLIDNGVETCTFENHKYCTEQVISNARNNSEKPEAKIE
ncbi:hypothetical protein [Brunnivagina elsteri]|uniref:VWFA domain-containing protein n=1 Tax=Brunnivagina elsteri CCALA 953 TaxID=987040 RepID=A0A2A2T9P4_9CYAN|nr:hypothetical protein [Calothrix elsteri]PAX45723.1 hypothetical protein CK510_30255 [Calothrix elsteri CCALA 953]